MLRELKTDKFDLHYRSDIIDNTLLWESHCHARLEMIAVIDGSVSITLEGRDHKLSHGEAIVIPPLCYHAISANKKGSYERLTVLFDQSAIPSVLRDSFSTGEIASCSLETHILSELQRVCSVREKEYYLPLADSLMIEALYELSSSSRAPSESKSDDTLGEILSYIDLNLSKMITLDDIATHTSRSKSSVCHIFEERMKISPKQYILQKKLALATQMIRSGIPPTSAAPRVGYDNYSNFYRLYKKHCGHSPTDDVPHKNRSEEEI